jgi:hypothetical protein
MTAKGCLGIVAASVWDAIFVIGQLGPAEQVSRADAQLEARTLERFLGENHSQAVVRNGNGFGVEVDSGIITIQLSNDTSMERRAACRR